VTDTDRDQKLQDIGKCAMDSIREMVAALECDYERLEELREERDDWEPNEYEEGSGKVRPAETWAEQNPDDAEELAELEKAAGECESREDAEQRIHEDPLSLQFRSGWVQSKEDMEPEEFELLLTTGGPAVRILGDIQGGEATRAYMQVQDWGTPWTDYYEEGCGELLLTYARCFCFEQ
jgi:hypothetical protein